MLDRRSPRGVRVAAPFAVLLTLLLLLAGCGGGSSSSTTAQGPDPASVAPAGSIAYVEANVRPQGNVRDGAVAAARKVLRVQDPGAELRKLIDRGLRNGSKLRDASYARDVEPWIGDRIGVSVRMPALDKSAPDVVAIIAARDTSALRNELKRLRRGGDIRAGGTYRGVTYDVGTRDGSPTAVAGNFLVIASSMSAFRATVDAWRGDSLAEDSRFQDAVDAAPDDALAFAYADPKAIAAAVDRSKNAPPAARRFFARYRDADPILASLTANADQIEIEASGPSNLVEPASSDASVTVGQLPGDSWLALATPPLGPLIRTALDGIGGHAQAAALVRDNLGLDLDRDLLEPLDGLGVFARGASPLDLGGGVLLQMTSGAAAQRLLTRLQTLVAASRDVLVQPAAAGGGRGFQAQIPQSPQPIVVLAKGDKLAAGYAASSARDLLEPQQRFDESSAGKAAIGTLGDGYTPSLVVIVPPIASLLRALDELQVADLSRAIPYVDAYRSLAVGTKRDGDRTTVRVVAALR
jgi:Protein of unknown function (DUF3352)